MRGLFTISLAAAATALEQGRVNLIFPGEWTPENVVASVVSVEPTATTFALDCPPKASDDCSLYIRSMTQGPRTWAYGGEWKDIMGVDEYTLNNECAVRQKNDRMVCTLAVTQVKGDRTASTEMVLTTTGLSDFVYPIPITAGAGKLKDEVPKPTSTSHTATSTSSSTSAAASTSVAVSTALPTVNLAAADATRDAAADPTKEPEDQEEDVEETPSAVPTAGASMSSAQAGIVGLAFIATSFAMYI